ncbi:leucine-rich repeat transmembrane protein kinase family protein [Striga hermonthica]|uniref:Leucine-rich repeat transmembrane protein kinase family protein n=1 Tax=Striga hermonthica TaxID=68872 RepID=A0A9N7RQT8_STRHE|nr:leucine-rich repeat transmembrane protein kinase family protein [Striga hermonthica]
MGRFSRVAAYLFVYLLHLNLASSQLPPDQIAVLTRIYDIFQNNTGPSFVWNNVSRDTNPCSWGGIDCGPDRSSVRGLSFRLFSLSTSEFFTYMCSFPSLESLDVSNNRLTSIPNGFFEPCGQQPSLLRSLNLSRNRLDGPLPDFGPGFSELEIVDFSHNSFTGEVNSQLEELSSLRSLNLSNNRFTGRVPTSLGQANLLEELQLSCNIFQGQIPSNITRYVNLTLVDLSINSLSGPIPEELGTLSRLQTLLLSINNLTGEIPGSISGLPALFRFAANQNGFSGPIPSGLTSYLGSLDLSFNKLTGTLPPDLLSGPNLQSVDLTNNGISGPIPPNISTSVFRLRLGSNSINGSIPAGPLRNLGRLIYLELGNNSLTGSIPSELGMCRLLALLDLSQNGLTGLLPPELGGLANLQVLSLQMNNFVGEIPSNITLLSWLQKLNMSSNALTGSIPLSISSLQNLTNLYLQDNNLSGPLPDSIGSLSSLIELQLGNNRLSGQIPAMPSNLQISLNLSYNLFSGPIPRTLSRLTGLEVLDLSNNRFSGEVPVFLTQLSSLTKLVLSNNNLTGVVPPAFSKHVDINIDGTNLTFPPPNISPPSPRRKRQTLASDVIIAICSAAVAIGLLVILAMFISRKLNRINDENHNLGQEEAPAPQVIHGKMLTSNSIHRSNIDFNWAMELVSDNVNLKLRTRFSTYYKAVMPSGASYFVKKLNWSDKIFQLGSHERFGQELQVIGKLCNSNVMVPLAYVLTADSAYLFYDFAPEGTLYDVLHCGAGSGLDWASRYSVAIGVSQGLAFLHDCNSGPILLLDLSSKGIMLRSMNEPQIGDIELCKVIDPTKGMSSLSTIAGSVGYIPPEYAYTMRVTASGNVYSFGIVLLELVTGKPAVSGGTELAKWVLSNSADQNKWDQILDSSVSKVSAAVRSQMLAVLKVALACVSVSPETRPKMKSVLRMLLNASFLLNASGKQVAQWDPFHQNSPYHCLNPDLQSGVENYFVAIANEPLQSGVWKLFIKHLGSTYFVAIANEPLSGLGGYDFPGNRAITVSFSSTSASRTIVVRRRRMGGRRRGRVHVRRCEP